MPLEQEGLLLERLFEALWSFSEKSRGPNRFSDVNQAILWMRDSAFRPKNLVVSQDLLDHLNVPSGGVSVGEFNGVRVLTSKLPPGTALLATDPTSLGVYVRVGDHLGLQLFNVDQTVSVIRTDGLVG